MSAFRLRLGMPGIKKREYEAIVVGAGPAGLTAALYLARYRVPTLVITKDIGGQMAEAPLVDDYIGIRNITGPELAKRFEEHVRSYGVDIVVGDPVVAISRVNDMWCVKTESEEEYCAFVIILAAGAEKRKLGVPGEDRLIGRGVSYCAVCDGPMFGGKIVAVVGGGNSALTSALYLSTVASKVYLIHRRDSFRAFPFYVDEVKRNPKIEMVLNSVVEEILGESRVEGIKIRNLVTGATTVLKVDGVFVEIGVEPPRKFLESIGLQLDEEGRVVVGIDRSTNLPGIFAAGDVAGGPYKYKFEQIITAAAEGAIAADAAYKYLLKIGKHKF